MGVGVTGRLLVHVLSVDRVTENVYPVFSLSDVDSEEVAHLLKRLRRISALRESEDREGDEELQVLHEKEPS